MGKISQYTITTHQPFMTVIMSQQAFEIVYYTSILMHVIETFSLAQYSHKTTATHAEEKDN